jgi:hypothetical protein
MIAQFEQSAYWHKASRRASRLRRLSGPRTALQPGVSAKKTAACGVRAGDCIFGPRVRFARVFSPPEQAETLPAYWPPGIGTTPRKPDFMTGRPGNPGNGAVSLPNWP